ncbi:SDR family oxidoreductase [Rhizobium alvei]|uniref:SDR family oxidoreductase n=1 Tax=Rhizobium alvei TaxID=1132659 RepID=A0ABT8YQZ0_9HYPH|nr:SDR family oxidoreductase [Rhizobium alvei]MDO6966139.1 SDR family oxidoreductase [Rhizobium alvei]
MTKWTAADIPHLHGRTAVVTGTGGLGLETALALARAGCDVTIAGRNPEKGAETVSHIVRAVPGATVQFGKLDLANLSSVTSFAQHMENEKQSLDLLVNNAGVMLTPKRQVTNDGFELQLGTNYLGHFALTARLKPLLSKGNARVVSLSSLAANGGHIDFDDINAEKNYRPLAGYSQSKLACLMFALELDSRSRAGGWGHSGLAAHPGVARTDLVHNTLGRRSLEGLARTFLWFLLQPASQGALPSLYAATSAHAVGGGYYGPDRLRETRGHPHPARIPAQALDPIARNKLWEISEHMTGIAF